MSNQNKYPVTRPTWGSNPGLTDRLIVGRNVTLTLTVTPRWPLLPQKLIVVQDIPPLSIEITQYQVVLSIDLTHNTTALHHNKTWHTIQETTEWRKQEISIERGVSFNYFFFNSTVIENSLNKFLEQWTRKINTVQQLLKIIYLTMTLWGRNMS
jgi:hypothetical protein